MVACAHVCERRVSPSLPSIPRLIVQHLQRLQELWHERCLPTEQRDENCITCICIERLGHHMGDAQALQLARALSFIPNIARLKVLQLCRNSIGHSGLKALFHSLGAHEHLQMQILALCDNPIGIFLV
jgi:hypothetical protein